MFGSPTHALLVFSSNVLLKAMAGGCAGQTTSKAVFGLELERFDVEWVL